MPAKKLQSKPSSPVPAAMTTLLQPSSVDPLSLESSRKLFSAQGGWGPSVTHVTLPGEWINLPYAPFARTDRLGRIADWMEEGGVGGGASGHHPHQAHTFNKQRSFRGGPASSDAQPQVVTAFSFTSPATGAGGEAGADNDFQLVDHGAASAGSNKKPFFPARKSVAGPRPAWVAATPKPAAAWGATAPVAVHKQPGYARSRAPRSGGSRYSSAPSGAAKVMREPSIDVSGSWSLMEEADFTRLNKLFFTPSDPADIEVTGKVSYYDKAYDRVSTKLEKPLIPCSALPPAPVTSSRDPVLVELSNDAPEDKFSVYVTDTILALLMTMTRSVYPWDIVATKKGNTLFLDKRMGSVIDTLSVNENAIEPPVDLPDNPAHNALNGPAALAAENTAVQAAFKHQVMKEGESVEFGGDSGEVGTAYRYRSWDMGEDCVLNVRTSLDAALVSPNTTSSNTSLRVIKSTAPARGTAYMTVRSLNEFDPRTGASGVWRSRLDAQRGAILATELKNNGGKLARFAMESLLAGTDYLKLGFCSRILPKDAKRHVILGSIMFKPAEIAAQMNLDIAQGWGMVKVLVDLIKNHAAGESGKESRYVIMKDANKPVVRVYYCGDADEAVLAI